MISPVTENKIQQILDDSDSTNLALYLQGRRPGAKRDKMMIQLKNMLSDVNSSQPETFPEELTTKVLDWANSLDSLPTFDTAVFLNKNAFYQFKTRNIKESHFHISKNHFNVIPLVLEQFRFSEFYVLQIDPSESRLFKVNGGNQMNSREFDEVKLPVQAQSLEKANRYDDPEMELQFHGHSRSNQKSKEAIFHSNEGDIDRNQKQRFLRNVDRAVMKLIEPGTAPLLVCGNSPTRSEFINLSHYPKLERMMIPENSKSPSEIIESAISLVEEDLEEMRKQKWSESIQLEGSDLVVDDLDSVEYAAKYGKVETLFVQENPRHLSDDDNSRLNELVINAFETGAEIFPLTDESRVLLGVLRKGIQLPKKVSKT